MFQGFYSTPEARELCRAHHLTGDRKYLAGAEQACLFSAGCNPNNMTYTTGLGANPPVNPLKVDARHTGQPTPIGQTVYGNDDFHTWPIKWYLSKVCVPSAWNWPIPEAYFDVYLFVAQNEYTCDLWGNNIYAWGYLAARK
jgi:endoglucanase